MENVYESAIVIWIIFMCWFTYKCCMSGYTTKKIQMIIWKSIENNVKKI